MQAKDDQLRGCCANCFGDPGLTNNIIPKVIDDNGCLSDDGECGYCGTRGTVLIDPNWLSIWFEMLLDCYSQADDGEYLEALLRRDWQLFDHPRMDSPRAKELLADILDDGEIVRRRFVRGEMMRSEGAVDWESLRSEIMHRNRWFLDGEVDLDSFGRHVAQTVDTLTLSATERPRWFRARIMSGDRPFDSMEMGAPPMEMATPGRANPAGIRYLYLASKRETAIAEIRPHPGHSVCVAEFEVTSRRNANLVNPRKNASPFILEGAEGIAGLWKGLPLLERLGEELSKPVRPQTAPFAYALSQYMCEYIKKCGFDGIVYQSSIADGVNMALFNTELATPGATSVVHVDRVLIDFSQSLQR